MYRVAPVLLIVVFGLGAYGCGSGNGGGAGASGDGNGGAEGNASATVTLAGTAYDLSGGSCEKVGVLGYQVTIGDYHDGQSGKGDFLNIIVSSTKLSTAEGRNGGTYWTLATDQTGSIGSDLRGSFSGTDVISRSQVSGTFACA